MIKVFAGKVRKTGFFQKAGFPGNSERIFGIYYNLGILILRAPAGPRVLRNEVPLPDKPAVALTLRRRP